MREPLTGLRMEMSSYGSSRVMSICPYSLLPADGETHSYQHPEDDQVPVLRAQAHQQASEGEGGGA